MALIGPVDITDEARVRGPLSASGIVGASALYLLLVTLFTGTRLYTRYTIYQQIWWDDCESNASLLSNIITNEELKCTWHDIGFMVLAWLGTVALCTLFIIMMQHGGGSK